MRNAVLRILPLGETPHFGANVAVRVVGSPGTVDLDDAAVIDRHIEGAAIRAIQRADRRLDLHERNIAPTREGFPYFTRDFFQKIPSCLLHVLLKYLPRKGKAQNQWSGTVLAHVSHGWRESATGG